MVAAEDLFSLLPRDGVFDRAPSPLAGLCDLGFNAGSHALSDQVRFELGDGGEHRHHHPSRRRREVHVVADGDERDAIGVEILKCREQVLHASTEPVELPDDDGLYSPLCRVVHEPFVGGTLVTSSSTDVLVQKSLLPTTRGDVALDLFELHVRRLCFC